MPGQGQEELADDREVSVLPSGALLALSGFLLRELTDDPCLRTEVRRIADKHEFSAEFLVLGEMPGRKVDLRCDREGQGHPGAHQLARQPEPDGAQWPHPRLDHPGKLRDPVGRTRRWRRQHGVASLGRVPRRCAVLRQNFERALANFAIGIHEDDDVRGIDAEHANAVVQREPFPTRFRIPPQGDFGARIRGASCAVLSAQLSATTSKRPFSGSWVRIEPTVRAMIASSL